MKLMETFDKWAMDGTMVLVGVIMLVGIFIACFFFKTFWGQWNDRHSQDEIYANREQIWTRKHIQISKRGRVITARGFPDKCFLSRELLLE